MKSKLLGVFVLVSLVRCGGQTILEGTWKSQCKGATPQIIELVFVNDAFTQTVTTYSDAACTSALSSETLVGTLWLGDAVTSPTGGSEMDWDCESLSMTPLTVGIANSMNGSTVCGFSDWASGVAKDVSALGSVDNCNTSARDIGKTILSVYKLDGTSLQINVGTETSRPTEFSSIVLTKQ